MSLTARSECNVLYWLNLTATLELNVGAPYQGDIRNLAEDRWYAMYPSY